LTTNGRLEKQTHAPQQFCRYSVIPVGAAKERKQYGKAEYGVGLSGFRMERLKGISIDENLKLMRCNNLPAVAFNFSSFHFCHTLINSSSRSREQTEQIL
jgi:hypothetical protein